MTTATPTPPAARPGAPTTGAGAGTSAGSRSVDGTGPAQPGSGPHPPVKGRSGARKPSTSGKGSSGGGASPAPGRTPLGALGDAWGRTADQVGKSAQAVTLTPPRSLSARDAGGFLAGLALYVVALQYLRHGPDGVRGWLAAKFLNRPWTPAGTERSSGTGGGGTAGGVVSIRAPRPTPVPSNETDV